MNEQRAPGDASTLPARTLDLAFDAGGVREAVAIAVGPPSGVEIAQQQQDLGQVEASGEIAGRCVDQHALNGQRLGRAAELTQNQNEETPQHERTAAGGEVLAQQGLGRLELVGGDQGA